MTKTKRGPGRPRLAKGKVSDRTVRLSEKHLATLRRVAKEAGVKGYSAAMRYLIEQVQ